MRTDYSPFFAFFRETISRIINAATSKIGNTTAASSPVFRESPLAPDTNPTSVGPPEHPRSPPNASSANIADPPPGNSRAARLYVPGHMTPTAKPQAAQPISPNAGIADSAANTYPTIHKIPHPVIYRPRCRRSLILA